MGRRRMGLALVVFFLGAAALAAGARTHENFAASSYYETEVDKPVIPSTDPSNSYHYNAEEGKNDNPEVQTTDTEKTTSNPAAIPKRYEAGYPNVKNSASYPQYTAGRQPGNQPDEFTFDPVQGRYKLGYHPSSAYAGATHKGTTTTTTNGGVVLTARNSNPLTNQLEGDFAHRYTRGYYPTSQYTQQGPLYNPQGITQTKPAYTSYSGQFSTMPYPASNGLPFVASGAGCRTAYWVEHIQAWPAFFKVTSTLGDAFGSQATATFGQTTMLQALMKYGNDPFNELERTGVTSLLNSYSQGAFPLSHMKVIEQFNAALASQEAAKAQALVFETKNVESISAGTPCT